ncbi:hypothetical protein CEXT_317911 [Caerostris extrusa]|uniref:Uncharacterized protein n=1 Tax=Caerostris extrusa TaxID=172846 RepID=A0AAV4M5W6_CAEEX|nr:hypothetical protein CEXT_317911 [Caerostris extrusa]
MDLSLGVNESQVHQLKQILSLHPNLNNQTRNCIRTKLLFSTMSPSNIWPRRLVNTLRNSQSLNSVLSWTRSKICNWYTTSACNELPLDKFESEGYHFCFTVVLELRGLRIKSEIIPLEYDETGLLRIVIAFQWVLSIKSLTTCLSFSLESDCFLKLT